MNCWTSLPDPQKYIQAYQKVAKAARQYDNIALVFSPNDVSNRTVTYETLLPRRPVRGLDRRIHL